MSTVPECRDNRPKIRQTSRSRSFALENSKRHLAEIDFFLVLTNWSSTHDATSRFTPFRRAFALALRLRRYRIHKSSGWNDIDGGRSHHHNMAGLWNCALSFRSLHLLFVFVCGRQRPINHRPIGHGDNTGLVRQWKYSGRVVFCDFGS